MRSRFWMALLAAAVAPAAMDDTLPGLVQGALTSIGIMAALFAIMPSDEGDKV